MTNKFDMIVQKYGGSSVADPQKIKTVAYFIRSSLQKDRRICVVVSAMGHTTNDLINLAHAVSAEPPKRELDMLISCGERSAMALLAMALDDIGVKAVSLTGSQSGIITDDHHHGAEIIAIRPNRVLEAFQSNQVVIIAGFQGVSKRKEITTLRRGGSDTTAVAMAAALDAKVCEIYTDVAGVMDVDPKIVACAEVLPAISFEQMEAMALYGAKVLAHDAIRLAKEFGVSLRIAERGDDAHGTEIREVNLRLDSVKEVVAITHLRAVIRFSFPCEHLDRVINSAGYFLCGSLCLDNFVGYISNDISQELVSSSGNVSGGLGLITVHLKKNQVAARVLSEINRLLKAEKLALKDLIVGRDEIFIVVDDDRLPLALGILHAGLSMKGSLL